jgi:hypothetical protein
VQSEVPEVGRTVALAGKPAFHGGTSTLAINFDGSTGILIFFKISSAPHHRDSAFATPAGKRDAESSKRTFPGKRNFQKSPARAPAAREIWRRQARASPAKHENISLYRRRPAIVRRAGAVELFLGNRLCGRQRNRMRITKSLHKRPDGQRQNECDEQPDFMAREFHRESAP